jgi:hypothetical protein
VATAGGTVSAKRLALVDRLIVSLKGSGVWQRLDRLWIFAAENVPQALVDLMDGGRARAINEPQFIADKGFVFDGSTQYIDTAFNARQEPSSKYSLNGASFGGYVFKAGRNGGVEFGSDYSAYSMLVTNYGAARRFQINSGTDGPARILTNGVLVGHFHGQRTDEGQSELFLDGVSQGRSTERSVRVPNTSFFVGVGRGNQGPGYYSSASISTAHIGGDLTSGQVLMFDKAVRSFLEALHATPGTVDGRLSADARVPPSGQQALAPMAAGPGK